MFYVGVVVMCVCSRLWFVAGVVVDGRGVFIVVIVFFFQAEDGIRYLVRSRGLGDVYKRQPQCLELAVSRGAFARALKASGKPDPGPLENRLETVSYTHLTLPTSDLV